MSRVRACGTIAVGFLVALSIAGCTSATAASRPAESKPSANAVSVGYPSADATQGQVADSERANYDTFSAAEVATARLGVSLAVPKRLGAATLTKSKVAKASAKVGKIARFDFDQGKIQLKVIDHETAALARLVLLSDEENRDLAPYLKKVKVGPFEARAIEKLDVPYVEDPSLSDPVWDSKVPGTGVQTGGAHVRWCVGKFEIDLSSATLGAEDLLNLANEAWPNGQ